MGNVDVVIPVYKPDKKLQMVISRLMGQTIVPSNIFLIHTRSSEDDWHTEQLLQEVQTEYPVVQVVSIPQEEFDHGGTRDMAMHLCKSRYTMYPKESSIMAVRDGWE